MMSKNSFWCSTVPRPPRPLHPQKKSPNEVLATFSEGKGITLDILRSGYLRKDSFHFRICLD